MRTAGNTILLCAIFSLLFAASGCREKPRLPSLAPEAVVLAFGDSLTRGTGATGQASYPAVLETLLQRRVVNAGVPGETSDEGLRRLPETLEHVRPDLVVLIHGGNDFLRRGASFSTAENLRGMIRLAREAGAAVVLAGVPRPGLFLSADPLYAEVAQEFGIPCEEDALSDILAERSLKSDAVHPNAAGYARLAEALAKLIQESQGH